MKTKTITIRVNESLYQDFVDMAESEGTNLSGLARQAIENICHQTSSERHQNDTEWYKSQMETRDKQIERLQSALDQSQQLQALTENRYQAEHQQLAEIKGRSLLQRLKAVLVANP